MFKLTQFGALLRLENGDSLLQEDDFNILLSKESYVVSNTFKPLIGFTEKIEWITDIINAYSAEQRIAVRTAPRIQYDVRNYLNEKDFKEIRAISLSWTNKNWLMPLWLDYTEIASISPADTQILFDTTTAEYLPNKYVAIIYQNRDVSYLVVNTVLPDRLIFSTPINISGTNVKICPVKKVRMINGITFNRGALNKNFSSCTFETVEQNDISDVGSYTQYKSLDVLLDCQPVLSGINEKILKSEDIFDNGAGIVEYDSKQSYLTRTMTCNFITKTKQTRINLRKFLHRMKGRRGSFWLPTFNNDIVLNQNISSSQTYMLVDAFGYGYFYDGITSDFVIQMKNGTNYFNRILSSSRDQIEERFELETSFGVAINIADIKRIMFIHKVRLDSDSVEFNYIVHQIMQTSIPVKEIPA